MQDLITSQQLDAPALLGASTAERPARGASIYVDAQPDIATSRSRGSAIDIKNRLAELERRIRAEGPSERARAVRGSLGPGAGARNGRGPIADSFLQTSSKESSAERRNSNPGDPWTGPNGFQDRRIQPLCHPSGASFSRALSLASSRSERHAASSTEASPVSPST
jgi:hypothetical protein